MTEQTEFVLQKMREMAEVEAKRLVMLVDVAEGKEPEYEAANYVEGSGSEQAGSQNLNYYQVGCDRQFPDGVSLLTQEYPNRRSHPLS